MGKIFWRIGQAPPKKAVWKEKNIYGRVWRLYEGNVKGYKRPTDKTSGPIANPVYNLHLTSDHVQVGVGDKALNRYPKIDLIR